VGKSGGLTMSECLASGRPLVVVGACPGQEAENLNVLERWGAGVRARAEHVGPFVLTLAARGELTGMAAAAHARGSPNAAINVWNAVDACVESSLGRVRHAAWRSMIDKPGSAASNESKPMARRMSRSGVQACGLLAHRQSRPWMQIFAPAKACRDTRK
jgi:hypothetical protein